MIPFKNILITVDANTNVNMALEKALELYEPFQTNIHLVSLIEKNFFHDLLFLYTRAGKEYIVKRKLYEAKVRLKEWENMLLTRVKGCLVITRVLDNNNNRQSFVTYIKEHNVDLVIIPNKAKKSIFGQLLSFNIEKAIEKANVTVLTFSNSGSLYPIRSILITVNMDVIDKKIQIALMLARKYNARIYVGVFINTADSHVKPTMDTFYVAYKTLMECGHPPQYKVLQGIDNRVLLLDYAEQIKADMIIVHQGKEASALDLLFQKMSGLMHTPSSIQIPVLQAAL